MTSFGITNLSAKAKVFTPSETRCGGDYQGEVSGLKGELATTLLEIQRQAKRQECLESKNIELHQMLDREIYYRKRELISNKESSNILNKRINIYRSTQKGLNEDLSKERKLTVSLRKNVLDLQSHSLCERWRRVATDNRQRLLVLEEQNILHQERQILDDREHNEWVGRTLKLNWIINKAKEAGAIREDHIDWIDPMLEEIVIPMVDSYVRNQFLPSIQDATMEFDGGELEQSEIYAELSLAASEHSELLGDNPRQATNAAILIQSIYRGYSIRIQSLLCYGNIPLKIVNGAAMMIQKIWRGFLQRGVVISESRRPRWSSIGYGGVVTDDIGNRIIYRGSPSSSQSVMPWSRGGGYYKRTITFINTGSIDAVVTWLRTDNWNLDSIASLNKGTRIDAENIVGEKIITIIGHWFIISYTKPGFIGDESSVVHKYIRIPYSFRTGNILDVNTGINFRPQGMIGIRRINFSLIPRHRYSMYDGSAERDMVGSTDEQEQLAID